MAMQLQLIVGRGQLLRRWTKSCPYEHCSVFANISVEKFSGKSLM